MHFNSKLTCPYCNKIVYQSNHSWTVTIGNPIKICPACKKELVFPTIYEWSVISPLFKLYYVFFANGKLFIPFYLYLITGLPGHKLLFYILLIFWIILCIWKVKEKDSKNIKESYQRTKDNPEYIQKLSDLGYMKLDPRIDPFYK